MSEHPIKRKTLSFVGVLLVLVVLMGQSCKDEPLTPTFFKSHDFPGTLTRLGNASVLSIDKHLLMIANWNNHGSILKVTPNGNLVWRKDYAYELPSTLNGIAQSPNGDIYVCGSEVPDSSAERAFIWKLNANGDRMIQKSFHSDQRTVATLMTSKEDGNIVIAGETQEAIFVMQVNSDLETMWYTTSSSTKNRLPKHIMISAQNNVVITHEVWHVPNSVADARVNNWFLDGRGNEVNDLPVIDKHGFGPGATVQMKNGDWITCGVSSPTYVFTRSDALGNLKWESTFPISNHVHLCDLLVNTSGNIMSVGHWYNKDRDVQEPTIFVVSPEGEKLWFKNLKSEKYSELGNAYQFDGVNYLFSGCSEKENKIFMFGMTPEGDIW